jgi:hypothetical protein
MSPNTITPWYQRKALYPLYVAVGLAIYLTLQTATNDGPWKPEHTRTPFATLEDRNITIHNIRDFRYESGGVKIAQEHYLSQTYSLDELQRVWFGLSHFGSYGLAHSFLSFEFSDDHYLTLSVEARQRPGQAYQPLMGLLRKYTKLYVMATEQDVIGVRALQRGERVLLYPVVGDGASTPESFFLALLEDMNALHEEAAFYNTLLDNCLTNLLKHSARVEEISLTDFRVLLPGHTDRLTYALGTTPDTMPFETARLMATINPANTEIDAADFPDMIRCGWHGFTGLDIPACPTAPSN